MTKNTIKIDTTKRGFAAMWEKGGGMTSGGSAQVITGKEGEARRPIYTPRGGHLACGKHALIGVANGFYVVKASVARGTRSSANISRIVSTSVKDIDGERWEATAEVEVINTFSRGEWDKPLDEKFVPAVEAAFRKAGSYHCRSAYYVDSSERPKRSEADKKRKEVETRRQDAERAKLRQAKADAEAKAKAEREAASKVAKDTGLGARLDAANDRIAVLGPHQASSLALHNEDGFSFKNGWQTLLYTEENITSFERRVEQMEREAAEKECKLQVRNVFQPKFEAFKPRAEALGLTVEFCDDKVKLDGDWYGDTYSDEGLANFEAKLVKKEQEVAEAKCKADADARYEVLKAEAEAAGLPQDIEIWKRSGATNAGNGWVIGTNGMDRDPTSMYNSNPRRLQRYGEGFMVWEQVLSGEVVLKWSKEYTAADHEFEIVHLPTEGLTPAQLERIAEIQNELAEEWDGRNGMSGNTSSPSVGDGWGLVSKVDPEPEIEAEEPIREVSVEDLMKKFNRR